MVDLQERIEEGQVVKCLRMLSPAILSVGALLGCASKPAPSAYLDYETKTELMIPILGEVLIGTGGRTQALNPDHIVLQDQRFAMDIVALAPGSIPPERDTLVEKILTGELKELYEGDDYYDNASHHCFGRTIVAPGDGVVIGVKDGVPDNVPGERNFKEIPGNYVVIDHLNGEFSMLAHFRIGSVLVKDGDRVRQGTLLGECGNSGHSNLPHLHYHLQNSPDWFKGQGLPAQFRNYYSNGRFIERGEPAQGEIVSNAQ